jgi:hypothetical protein
MTKILDSDVLDANTLALLFATWAPNTTTTYGKTIPVYFGFCDEYILALLATAPAH